MRRAASFCLSSGRIGSLAARRTYIRSCSSKWYARRQYEHSSRCASASSTSAWFSCRSRYGWRNCSHSWQSHISNGLLGKLPFENTPTAVQPRHDCSDRDIEDLRGLGVAEVADVHEHDHVAEVVWDRGQRVHDRVLGEPLVDALLVRDLAAGVLELLEEVVVARLEGLHVGRALELAAAVDVDVREDAEEPRTEVRSRSELLPASERARVGLLDEVLGFLPRVDHVPRDSIDLIRKIERLLLETHAVACLSRDAACVGVGSRLAHAHDPSSAFRDIVTHVTRVLFPLAEAGVREPCHDFLAARAPLVPGQRHLPDEVRVRLLEPVVALEGGGEPHHAPLAADAVHLERLGLERHAALP